MTNTTTLHYIYDPLCGWCYGASPLLQAARKLLPVRAHGGGLMAGKFRRQVSRQLRDYVIPQDRRIAQASGQQFGDAYFDGLLCDESAVFDSGPPIAAMLAAEKVAGRGLDMISRLQIAHYVEGRRIAESDVLIEMACATGIDGHAFVQALSTVDSDVLESHIVETQQLMGRLYLHGFPGLALEQNGKMSVIDIGAYMGRPDALSNYIKARLTFGVKHPASSTAGFSCGPESCSL